MGAVLSCKSLGRPSSITMARVQEESASCSMHESTTKPRLYTVLLTFLTDFAVLSGGQHLRASSSGPKIMYWNELEIQVLFSARHFAPPIPDFHAILQRDKAVSKLCP